MRRPAFFAFGFAVALVFALPSQSAEAVKTRHEEPAAVTNPTTPTPGWWCSACNQPASLPGSTDAEILKQVRSQRDLLPVRRDFVDRILESARNL